MQTTVKLAIVIFIAICNSCSTDKKIEASSKYEHWIIDHAYILSQPQRDSILTLIKKLDQEIGSQIAVVTISTLGTETIEAFSLRTAEKIRVGRSTHNDGILITVVTNEREMRMEVGTGLENIIKDEVAARINRDVMAPLFRQKKYGQGIYLAVENISNLIVENKELVGTEPK